MGAKEPDGRASANGPYEVNCRTEKLIEENTALTLAVKERTDSIYAIVVEHSDGLSQDQPVPG